MNMIKPYIDIIRPTQWIKNLLVFVPLFFSGGILQVNNFLSSLLVVLIFILSSSLMYVLNDIVDQKQDALHPIKRLIRPLASGVLSLRNAWVYFITIGLTLFVLLYNVQSLSAVVPFVIFYCVLNVAYSYYFKRVPVVELVCVSTFYLIRVFAGGAIVGVVISDWLVLCLFFTTILIVSSKRFAEKAHGNQRKVVTEYSEDFLKHVIGVSAGITILSYGLYSILEAAAYETMLLFTSMIFVVIAILRFLMIAFTGEAEFPEKKLLEDQITRTCFIIWLIVMYYIFYLV